jgi:hypothetical protein
MQGSLLHMLLLCEADIVYLHDTGGERLGVYFTVPQSVHIDVVLVLKQELGNKDVQR